jgi:hypothetical protein
MEPKPDIGMKIKMGDKCFAGIKDLDEGTPIDETEIRSLCAFADDRPDCADFRMICLLKGLLAYKDLISEETKAVMKRSILAFKYAMSEPGIDSMCYWSENHQVLVGACEYLAGMIYPEELFSNNGMTGKWHREHGEEVLLSWMEKRFRFGFAEWHSNTYYEEDAAPLAVLVDHAGNPEIAEKAAIILDLLFLDMAQHRFEGRFVAASGRCYEKQKKDSSLADVNDLLRWAFGNMPGEPDWHRISSCVLLSKKYHIPEAIKKIASQKGNLVIRDSFGLDLKEVPKAIPDPSFAERGLWVWAMEAFTNVETIETTIDMVNAWGMQKNAFVRGLSVVNKPFLRKLRLLPPLLKILNPATQGVAIQRANTYTFRTDDYLLSSVRHHHPKWFGDQEHLWQATLPNHVNVFSTHPGCPMFDDSARNFSPDRWVGNGIKPDIAQDRNVLLMTYDLHKRKGYLERKRENAVHFYVPSQKVDEFLVQEKAFYLRVKDSWMAVRSLSPLYRNGDDEIVFPGKKLHFAVILGSVSEGISFRDFLARVSQAPLFHLGKTLTLVHGHRYALTYDRRFTIDGTPIPDQFPRHDSPFVKAERNPKTLSIACGGASLFLDFANRIRKEE